jgi:hypothetical protein
VVRHSLRPAPSDARQRHEAVGHSVRRSASWPAAPAQLKRHPLGGARAVHLQRVPVTVGRRWLLTSLVSLCAITAIVLLRFLPSHWQVPQALVGTWSSTQVVTVRLRSLRRDYRFVSDTVSIRMVISPSGRVEGSLGGARFEGCSVSANRTWLGRFFNLGTDYIVLGQLSGGIFTADTLARKGISAPFTLQAGSLEGTLFQKQGLGVFPMVQLRLSR